MTRNRASAKKAGSSFETLIASYLAKHYDDRVERRVKNGTKDRGDISGVKTIRGGRVVLECKNQARDNMPAWLREADIERANDDAAIGVVVHKKHGSNKGGEQYVTMTLDTFVQLLEGGAPELRGVGERK